MITNFIGRQLGNYRLVKLLGEGGFASVYLGQHVQIATQQVAIKVLHLTQVNTQQFQQEAETIAALKHPHIIRLLDFALEQGTPFLVLDYAPNGSLRARHALGEQLSLATVIEYVTQIADALQYAHDQYHIIHRDIKPDNVLIDQHGTLLLSDFGIAVISKTGHTTRSVAYGVAGTPYYMAPEMFRGKPEKASDQYSLAVMVYQWLSGTLPFDQGNLGVQHIQNPVPPLRDKVPTLSADVEAVIMRALSKQPQDRFPSVREFAEELEAVSKKPAISQQLGNYRLVELLGEGGFASVYLGQHVNIATQQAAIKILHLAGIDQQKFQHEAETIAALRHPHIVRLLDFAFQSGTGTPFLVLDFAPNGSLHTHHTDGELLPLTTVVQYVTQIADALQYAHDKYHIIHCDIKPDNVLIDQQGGLLLSDFGIAVMSQAGRTTVQSSADLPGTPAYMAPEMFTAQPVFASDQYSLAVMVYQWLSGTLPFGKGDFHQLEYQHTHELVPLLRDQVPTIPADVEAVVLKGLAKQPQDRFPRVRAFAEALDSASKQPAVGQQWGDYRLVKLLGERGFASVYLGQHVNVATKQAAIKILRPIWVDQENFLQEAQTIAALKHPHIVCLLDFGIQYGRPFLVLDYAPNGSLRTRHADGEQLPLATVVQYVTQIADALQYAYDQHHIVHCDLKPSNVLVDQHGELLLSDFGITVISQTGRTTVQSSVDLPGTPAYMAPEMFRGKPEKASDQYALAVMVYRWLSGTLPFGKGDFHQLEYQHTHEPVPLLLDKVPTISADVEAVIMRSLSKQPQDRFPSMQAFADELEAASKQLQDRFPSVRAFAKALDSTSKKPPIGTRLLAYRGHNDAPGNTCAWSPDSKRLATGGSNGLLKIWDAITGQLILTCEDCSVAPINAVAWSSDGRRLASGDEIARVWDASSGRCILSYKGHSSSVEAIAWSPDGHRLASASDHTVLVWDSANGNSLLSFHHFAVSAVAWSPDGHRLASASRVSNMQVWDAASAKPLLSFYGHSASSVVAWSPDGRRLASTSGPMINHNTVQVWDAANSKALLSFKGLSSVRAVAWSPNGRRLASASDDTVLVWNSANGKALLSFHHFAVSAIAWSPNGRRLASASDDTVLVWNSARGQRLLSFKGHLSSVWAVAWSPNGRRLASASRDTVLVWDAANGNPLLSFHYSAASYRSVLVVAWSLDGRRLASASWDKTVQVWDAANGSPLLSYKGHSSPVLAIAWSPDGCRLASTSDHTVQVWDAANSKALLSYKGHSSPVSAIAWSPDGCRLASTSDHTVQVWDSANGNSLLSFKGHSSPVSAIAWSPDGRRLASASNDTVLVWDSANGNSLLSFKGHLSSVWVVAWSPDGRRLATTSWDKAVQVWDSANGALLHTYDGHGASVKGIAWSPDGTCIASGADNGVVVVWQAV